MDFYINYFVMFVDQWISILILMFVNDTQNLKYSFISFICIYLYFKVNSYLYVTYNFYNHFVGYVLYYFFASGPHYI
jgi:hypothetical protein